MEKSSFEKKKPSGFCEIQSTDRDGSEGLANEQVRKRKSGSIVAVTIHGKH